MLTDAEHGEAAADIALDPYARAKGLGTISGSGCPLRRGARASDVPGKRGR